MGTKELTHAERVEAEVRSTIKRVLTEVEEASGKQPLDALHPYEFNDRRKRVIRAIWSLMNVVQAQPETQLTETYECPHCSGLISVSTRLNG